MTAIPPRGVGWWGRRRRRVHEPLQVLYLGGSAELAALRRLMEAHGAVTRVRLTPAVAVVVADPSVPGDHPTVRAAASLGIPIMASAEAQTVLLQRLLKPGPSHGAGVATDAGEHAAAREGDRSKTGSHLLDDLLDTAEQALREKLHPTGAAVGTGSSPGPVDAQLDELVHRADAALRATLSDQGTSVGRSARFHRESSVGVTRPDPRRRDTPHPRDDGARQPRRHLGNLVLHRRQAADLSTAMIYALLRLRVEVFVIELGCPYQDLDGHDLERTTRHYWLAPDAAIEEPQATLRLWEPLDGHFRIDRICTARQARRQGGLRRLLEAALAEVGNAPCVLDAQRDFVELFSAYGFVADGAEFTEAGIPHVPMRRLVTARARNGV